MDAVLKEYLLLHLREHSPELEHWMDMGGRRRGDEYKGFAIDADAFRLEDKTPEIEGLWLAVELLAQRCLMLERRLEDAG